MPAKRRPSGERRPFEPTGIGLFEGAGIGRYTGRRLYIQDDDAYRAMSQSLAHIDRLRVQFTDYAVRPNSSLAADDAATPDSPISVQAFESLRGAVDHLDGVRASFESPEVPLLASFTLLRGALEGIGTGLWLLTPTSRDERILRSLQASYESLVDEAGYAAALAGTAFRESEFRAPQRARLEALRDARSGLVGRSLRAPTISQRLGSVQAAFEAAPAFHGSETMPLLLMWKFLSGLAHGRRYAVAAALEHSLAAASADDCRPDTSSLVAGTFVQAETYLLRLFTLLRERGAEAPQGRATGRDADSR